MNVLWGADIPRVVAGSLGPAVPVHGALGEDRSRAVDLDGAVGAAHAGHVVHPCGLSRLRGHRERLLVDGPVCVLREDPVSGQAHLGGTFPPDDLWEEVARAHVGAAGADVDVLGAEEHVETSPCLFLTELIMVQSSSSAHTVISFKLISAWLPRNVRGEILETLCSGQDSTTEHRKWT
jgi:hypothetical protein